MIILCKVGLISINFCMATIVSIVCNLLLKVLSAVTTIVLTGAHNEFERGKRAGAGHSHALD